LKINILIITTILSLKIQNVAAHSEGAAAVGDELDTGSEFDSLSLIFVSVGVLIFLLILASAIWLLKRDQIVMNNPISYGDKVNSFGRNARLYILHVQGMSLTYGVRSIIYAFYLLYVFRNGVDFQGSHYGTVYFIALLFAAGAIVSGIMAPFNGIIVDRIGKKWSFILGDFLGACAIFAIIFIQTPEFVILAHVLRAAVMSVHSIAEAPFIYEQSTEKERVHLFSVTSGMSTFASASGALVAGVVPLFLALVIFGDPIVSGNDSIFVLQVALFISVLFWWLSLLPAFFLREDPILKAKAKEMSVSARITFRNVKHWRTVSVFVLSSIFIGFGASMFVQFFEIFFLLKFNANPAQISIIFAIGSLFIAFGNILSPILADKFGKVNMIVGTRLVSVVFMMLMPFSPYLFLAGFFYLSRGLFMNATGPTESALAMETVDDEERTTMEALRQSGSSIFSAIGFIIGGFYFNQERFLQPFAIASILYLISIFIFWMHFKGEGPVHLHSQQTIEPIVGR
jgi:MFS family permease